MGGGGTPLEVSEGVKDLLGEGFGCGAGAGSFGNVREAIVVGEDADGEGEGVSVHGGVSPHGSLAARLEEVEEAAFGGDA